MLFILCLEFYFFISPFQITLKVIYNLRVVVVDKSKFAKLRQYKKINTTNDYYYLTLQQKWLLMVQKVVLVVMVVVMLVGV